MSLGPGLRAVSFGTALAAVLLLCTGCGTASYLTQAAFGQLDLLEAARPIDEVVASRKTPPRIRALLQRVGDIKRFGERRGLTPTGSYTQYADLDRPVAVWVVNASEPLRFHTLTWSFPIAGSVPYLGFFDRDEAKEFAADLRKGGWDVDLRGASAYSTLGWFKDPVLSTMIAQGDEALGELADVVLHESLHATLYVKGQSLFNESVADFVGDTLAAIYLDEALGPASPEKKAWIDAEAQHDRRALRMHEAYVELDALYASSRPREAKLAEKQRILDALRRELGASRPINNATLSQAKTYSSGRPELAELLGACGGAFPRFVGALKTIEASAFHEPQQQDIGPVLRAVIAKGCP
jgi:predicted aminopeptidase